MGASKQAMMDEVDRIGREEYDEDDNAVIEEDLEDAAVIRKSSDPKTVGYDNDELVEVILDLQKKAEKDNE